MTGAGRLFMPALIALIAVGAGGVAGAASRSDVKRIVVEESLRAGFPPSLAMAVAKAESDFRDDAESPAGARGVMQVMPRTAKDLYGVAADELWDARLNARIGIDYLQRLIRRYGGRWDVALSHYNGGSAVGAPSNPRVIPATGAHVNRVLRLQREYRQQARLWAAQLKTGGGALASIRAPYAKRPAGNANDGDPGLDDFERAIEVRRRAARLRLDDFAPLVRRAGG